MSGGAAIYARFSSDQQRDASIEDQVRVCRTKLERDGWTIIEIYTDHAISGATALRPGFQAMVADSRKGLFDVVFAESLDRFSRDQEHIAGFFKQMKFAGVLVSTLAEGDVSELHIGLKGTMGALYLKDLAQKTRRGLEGRVRAGRSAGGLSYGYRVIRGFSGDSEEAPGAREIDAEQAMTVRRIFTNYANGLSPRAIARSLNQEGISGPRGGKWSASLLHGNVQREIGVLRNRLYAGELVWNRQRFIKDPTTGKRVARPNPRSEWIVEPVPSLRIIDAPLWDAVHRRLEVTRRVVTGAPDGVGADTIQGSRGGRLVAARRPAWPLSGLVRCGMCGGGMTVMGAAGRLGCANHRERGTCENRRTVLRERILPRVLEGLKHRLLAPELVEIFVTEYIAASNQADRDADRRRAHLANELARVDRQISAMVRTVADTGGSRALVEELRRLERRQDELRVETTREPPPEPRPALHPNLAQVYRQKVERLEQALRAPAVAVAAVEALRSLIDAILVHPGERRGEVRLELRGDLAAFLHLPDGGPDILNEQRNFAKAAAAFWGSGGSTGMMGSLVAGTGFEPVTFRL